MAHCWAAHWAQRCATPWTMRWFKGWTKGWADERAEGRPVLSPLQRSAAFEAMPEWPGPLCRCVVGMAAKCGVEGWADCCTAPAADVKAEGWAILSALERIAALEAVPAWPRPRRRCVVGMAAKC